MTQEYFILLVNTASQMGRNLDDLSHYDLGMICPTHYWHSAGH